MQPKRFVNLNRATTYLQDPRGVTIGIRPFRETLDEQSRKADGIYVVEGEFWQKYVSGSTAGPLHNYPSPQGFGRDSFPPVAIHRRDGSEGDGLQRTDGSASAPVVVQAVPGRFRAAGDVLTPEGKIRRRNPVTGEDELVEDTLANRSVLRPVNEPGQPPEQLRQSIVDYLEEKGIETVEQFDKLTDDQLLKIPGMNPLAVKHVRENMRALLQRIEEKRAADAAATEKSDDEEVEDSDDDEDDAESADDSDEDSDDEDDADEDGDDEEEEAADGRTPASPATAAKSKARYTPPTAPAKPKPATFAAKPKPKPKAKTKTPAKRRS